MPPITYSLPIDINANKETVWAVITDFKKYSEWNSTLSISGNDHLEIGRKFQVIIHERNKNSKFKATVLSKKDLKSFSAEQKIIGSWFFSAVHHFIVKSAGNKTRFVQQWELSGLISKLFKTQILKQLALFNQMNQELKLLLEQPEKQLY